MTQKDKKRASRARPAASAPPDMDQLAKLAVDMAGIGYWRYTDGRFEWSSQMYRIYGLDPSTPPPTMSDLGDFCLPDDRAKVAAHNETYAGKEAPPLEFRLQRPDGEIRHIITHSTVLRDEAGEYLGRFGTLVDVTDTKRAEAEARENEQRYRFIADNAAEMIARIAINGEVKYVSPGAMRVFGYTPEEHMRQTPQDMTHPDDIARVAGAIMGMVQSRTTHLDEPLRYRAKHKSGEWIWIESNPTLILDSHGEPIETIDVIRDVTQAMLSKTELEEAKRRAETAATAKSAFLANMSHELRTPLTSIVGFSRLLGAREDLPQEAMHYAKRISDASEALLTIINDVLDFSKLEAGQVSLEALPLSLPRLLEETTGFIAIQAAAKGVDVRVKIAPATPEMIVGDVARLRQVLVNLLSNAVKFTDHGSITVQTAYRRTKAGGRLKVSVTDTGAGVAPENLPRLFGRFSQADVSINRTHGGTGLGLAISKGIVETMGGKIGVRSHPGEGSTFWFVIPAEAAGAEPEHAAPTQTEDCPPLRLLVVDDTPVNRELVRLILTPLGLEVQEASGGAEGVSAALAKPFDVIIMDVRMPGIDGLEATRMIRATSPFNRATPILALTADVEPQNARACLEAGMNDVLAKPIVPKVLLSKILEWAQTGAEGEEAPTRANA